MKKFLFLGISALLAASVTSCKDDMLSVNDQTGPEMEVLDHDQTFYVGVNLRSVMEGTRAGQLGDYGSEGYDPDEEPNFDRGSKDENAITSIFLIFYDAAGRRVHTTDNVWENPLYNNLFTDVNNSEHSIWAGVVEVQAKHGLGLPAQVMALVNPISPVSESTPEFENLSELVKTTREFVVGTPDAGQGKTDLFAMSKSSYYGPNPNNTDDPQQKQMDRIIATPITTDMLCSTEDGAKFVVGLIKDDSLVSEDVTGKGCLEIYVERYAAKVNFSFTDDALGATSNSNHLVIPVYDLDTMETETAGAADEDVPSGAANQSVTLVFEPEYWAVNAYEDKTFITKSFFDEFEIDDDGKIVGNPNYASYESMDGSIGGANGWTWWNSPTFHRCYWGQSPSYYSSRYPRNSDDIMDKRSEKHDRTDKAGYSLGYYSYNEMVENSQIKDHYYGKARAFTNGVVSGYKSSNIYVRENTVSGEALIKAYGDADASPKAAIASVVVAGKYKVTDDGTGRSIDYSGEGKAFYITGSAMKDYRFHKDEDAILQYFYRRINLILSSDNKERQSIFIEDPATHNLSLRDNYKDIFTIEHPSADVRGTTLVIDSRFVTLQFNLPENFAHGLYINVQNSWLPVNDENMVLANYNLLSAAGLTRQFTNGMAYFNIPINHLGFYRNGNPNIGLSPNGTVVEDVIQNEDGTQSTVTKRFDWKEVKTGDFGLVRNHSYNIQATMIQGLGNAIPDPEDPIVPPTDPDAYYLGTKIIILNWAVVPTQYVTL